jgi:hypothetical protein
LRFSQPSGNFEQTAAATLGEPQAQSKLRGVGMSDYQVHFLDEWGRIVRTVKVECDGDEQARTLAQDPAGCIPTELWQGDRLIERYEPALVKYSPLGGQPVSRRALPAGKPPAR